MMRKLLYSFLFFISNYFKKTFKPGFGLLCVGMFFVFSFANAATITSTTTGGNWGVPSTWSGGIVPLSTDIVVIASGANVFTNGNQTCAGITITGRLTMVNNEILTVNGNVTGNGNWTTAAGSMIISLTGNWSFTGTSTGSGATAVFTGTNTQTLSGRITNSGGELRVNKTGGSVILGSAFSIGTFTNTAGIFDAATYLLTASTYNLVAGTLRVGATTWAGNYSFVPTSFPTGFTVEYDAAAQTVRNLNYANLTLSGSGTKTLAGATTISGNLNILSGVTFSTSSNNYAINLGGDFTNNGAFTAGSGTVTFDGTSVALIQGTSTTTFNNLTVNKSTVSTTVTNNSKAFAVNGNLAVNAGNLVLTATDNNYQVDNDVTVSTNSTLTHNVPWDVVAPATGKLLRIGGNLVIDGTYSHSGVPRSHVNMYNGNRTIKTGSSTSALSILTFSHTSGDITANGPVKIESNFWCSWTTNGGRFVTGTNTVEANGGINNAGGSILVNGGTLSVTGGGLLIGNTGYNGGLSITSGNLNADSVSIGDGTSTGTLAHSGGIVNIGNLTISNTGTYTCTNSPALNISGTWANGGTFTRATSTVTFNGATDQTVPNFTYYNLVFSGSGTKTFTAATTVNNLSIALGVMANLGTGLVHTAATLTIGGLGAASGSWGSTTSSATNKNNTYFSLVTGIINVSGSTCVLPTLYNMSGTGGTLCSADPGYSIGLANSQTGVNYQLLRGTVAVGSPISGTGAAISFGTNFKTTGVYTVSATNTTTFCTAKMNGTVNITAYSTPTIPSADITNVSCPSDTNGAITITGTPAPAALSFVSSSNQVANLNTTLLSGRSAFTVEGWIKFNKANYVERMALFGQNDAIEIALEANNIRCWTPGGGSVDLPLSSYPSDNNWHHIAVTGNGVAGGLTIYLDGVSSATGGSTTTNYGSSTYTTKIGYGVMDAAGVGFTGQIFKVGFWDKALTATEVTALAGGFVEYDASQTGLLAGFNFSEGTGTTLSSVGSSAVNAAITAASMWTDPSTYSWTSTAGFTSSSKNLTGLTPRTYNLNISLKNCSRSTSFTVNATNTAPSITTQPSSSAICVGSNTSFSVVGAGTGVSYRWQWRVNSSGTFANVPNSGVYSNVATATMNITGATTGMNGYQYRVVVSGTCTPTVNSDVVTLTVNPNLAASVSISAPSTTICAGTSVTFTANPTNQGTAPTYQWKLNGSDVGTNSTTYTTTGLTNGSTVTCVLTSNATPCLTGSPTTSNTVTMTVNPNQPASVSIAASTSTTICAGTSVTFTATPTNPGTAPTYQWKVNGGNVGTNSATYTTTGLVNNDQVTCVMISNATPCLTGSPATSNTVTITVNPIQTTPTVGTKTDVTCLNQGTIPLSGLPSGSWQINQIGPGSATSSFGGAGSTTTVTGLAAGTYKFTVQTATTCVSAETAPVTITDESSTEWDGSNWSHGLPDNTKSVVIKSTAGNPFPNDIEGCSLTIDVASGFVTVPTGRTLTITNAVNGNGKLLFKTGSSLIQKNASIANTTEIVYERETYVRRYDGTYWSMPVTKDHFKMVDFSPNTLADKYLLFSPLAGWVVNYGGTEDMKTGKGYGIRAPQSNDINTPELFKGVFTGTPNNGNIPVTVESGLWNLVGNPYPSAISARTFLDDNPGVGAIYLWAHQSLPVPNGSGDGKYYYTDDFTIFNSLGAAGNPYRPFLGYIAATQGFLIKAPAATTTINFNNLQRLAGNNSQFYKTAESAIERNRVWINLTNTTGTFKQILLGYATGATNAIDVNFDALSMASTNAVDFYSINSSKKMIIQGRALPFLKTDTVPLGIILTAKGEYTIAIDHADGFFNDGQDIYLQDKTTGKTTNLRLANYTFTSEAGSFNSRFVLRYTDNTLGTDDFDSLENSVLVSVKNKTVKITSSKESIKEVNIFNIGAQLMYTKNNVNSSELEISNLHSSDQALLVKITLENGHSFTKKIIYSNL